MADVYSLGGAAESLCLEGGARGCLCKHDLHKNACDLRVFPFAFPTIPYKGIHVSAPHGVVWTARESELQPRSLTRVYAVAVLRHSMLCLVYSHRSDWTHGSPLSFYVYNLC